MAARKKVAKALGAVRYYVTNPGDRGGQRPIHGTLFLRLNPASRGAVHALGKLVEKRLWTPEVEKAISFATEHEAWAVANFIIAYTDWCATGVVGAQLNDGAEKITVK